MATMTTRTVTTTRALVAGAGPILRAHLGPWRGPPPVGRPGQAVPGLRLRHRHHEPRPRPSRRQRGDPRPGRSPRPRLERPGLRRVRRTAWPSGSRRPAPPRSTPSSSANSGAEAIEAAMKLSRRVTGRPGVHRLPRRLPRAHVRGGQPDQLATSTTARGTSRSCRAWCWRPSRTSIVTRRRRRPRRSRPSTTLFEGVIPAAEVAAIIVEPVQGEGGINPAPAAFLRGLRERCDRHGILLVIDEIQTGLGADGQDVGLRGRRHRARTSSASAKAIANGLPLAGIVSRRELQERWGVGAHGTTFGGNPVACAAAVAVLRDDRGARASWPTRRPRARR